VRNQFAKVFPKCEIFLETRLESESFEPSINFLAFLGQKSSSKINKLIIKVISRASFVAVKK